MAKAVVNPDACVSCEACLGACPVEGTIVMEGIKAVVKADTCIECGSCISSCPANAISEA